MPVTKSDIRQGLQDLGLLPGAQVLVHSSLSSFGKVEGGATAVINAVLETVGCWGTVLMPTYTPYTPEDSEAGKIFDVKKTPASKSMGLIPETFRTTMAEVRSAHPTHSVAVCGTAKKVLASAHHLSESPFDRYSPFNKLVRNGWILMLGVTPNVNTSVHTFEDRTPGFPYKTYLPGKFEARVRLSSGQTATVNTRLFNPEVSRLRDYRCVGGFKYLDDYLTKNSLQSVGMIGKAKCRLMMAHDLMAALSVMLDRGITIYDNKPIKE